MTDNTQLAHGLRASVVMTEFIVPEEDKSNGFVRLHLVVFPAASASVTAGINEILLEQLLPRGKGQQRAGERP